MINPNSWQNSQNKILGQNSVSANYLVNIVSGSNTIKSYTAPKNVGYLYYTSPSVDSTYKFSITSSSGETTPGQNQQPGPRNHPGRIQKHLHALQAGRGPHRGREEVKAYAHPEREGSSVVHKEQGRFGHS